jgi:hypothetical protein
MAECPSCKAPLKDGDWTCGQCGAPVAGAGMAAAPDAGDYHETYGRGAGAPADTYGSSTSWGDPHPAAGSAAAAPSSAGSSGLLRLVLIIGVIAILAIVLVWFFVLRGPTTTGEEFVGTWTASTQTGIATATIAKTDDAFTVTISGSQQGQKVAVPAHLDGKDLVITLDDFSQMGGEAGAGQLKDALKALAGDFRMIFSSVDAQNLSLQIMGTSPAGQDYDQTYPMAKDVAAGT